MSESDDMHPPELAPAADPDVFGCRIAEWLSKSIVGPLARGEQLPRECDREVIKTAVALAEHLEVTDPATRAQLSHALFGLAHVLVKRGFAAEESTTWAALRTAAVYAPKPEGLAALCEFLDPGMTDDVRRTALQSISNCSPKGPLPRVPELRDLRRAVRDLARQLCKTELLGLRGVAALAIDGVIAARALSLSGVGALQNAFASRPLLRRQLDAGLAELTEEWPKLEEALSPAERAGINICDGGTILRLDGERTIEAPLSSRDDLQVGMPIVVPTIAGYMRALVERDENGVLSWRAGEHTTGNLEFDADSRGCWITSESRIARSAKVLWVVWQHRRPRLEIGQAFTHPTTGDLWKVTDIGKRTVIAINVTATMAEHAGDESWLRGPPYAIAEHVWDEYSLGALLGAPDVEWEDIPTGTSIPKG